MLVGFLIVFFILFVGGGAFAAHYMIKKTSSNYYDESTNENIQTAQEFLPFVDIRNGMIDLGGHNYRSIIEVGSINYDLRTFEERNMINQSYQRFLNSLTGDISIYIQTKKIDLTQLVDDLKVDLGKIDEKFPHMKQYGDSFYNEMVNLTQSIGNNMQKKKYIIVHFHEAQNLDNLTDVEKYEYSAKEIFTKANIIVDGLSSIGLKTNILQTADVAEVVYSAYHRGDFAQIKNIVNGEYMTNIVEGEKNYNQPMEHMSYLDHVLYEAMHTVQQRLQEKDMTKEERENYEKAFLTIEALRS